MEATNKNPNVKLFFTEDELCERVANAKPGDIIEYFRGFILSDDIRGISRLSSSDRSELRRVARFIRQESNEGIVYLVQRRHGDEDYSYLAIVSRKNS